MLNPTQEMIEKRPADLQVFGGEIGLMIQCTSARYGYLGHLKSLFDHRSLVYLPQLIIYCLQRRRSVSGGQACLFMYQFYSGWNIFGCSPGVGAPGLIY